MKLGRFLCAWRPALRSLQCSRPIYQHRYIISALMDTITTQTTGVCPCRIFMVRRPIYSLSPALVSFMAAIGVGVADIHMAAAGSPMAGATQAVAVTSPRAAAIPEAVVATPAEADMDTERGTVVISSRPMAAASASSKSKPPNRTQPMSLLQQLAHLRQSRSGR